MKKIRLHRLLSGKTQKTLAEEIGCTQPLISMLENEKLFPGLKLKDALSKALNLSKDELYVEANGQIKVERFKQ